MATEQKMAPVHPGEILKYEFLEPMGLSQNKLAEALSVSARRVSEIVNAKRSVTADTALRLARFFGTTPGFWMNLQTRYELDGAEDALHDLLEKEVRTKEEIAS